MIRIVLVEPREAGNVGAAARVMKNFEFEELWIAGEHPPLHPLAGWWASGADDVVEHAHKVPTLFDAIRDAHVTVATTSQRGRATEASLGPFDVARLHASLKADQILALVFGREDSGLPNDAIERAHAVVSIPTTEHSSINLAQAVLIALYELHLAAGDVTRVLPPARKEAPPPTAEELQLFYDDLGRALERIQFFKTRYAEHIMRSMRAMVTRADPDARELMLLRAIFIEVVRYIERTTPRP